MIAQSLLPEFDMEMANTRKVLERVPDDKFGWKPHEKSFSLGDLATHLANIPSWTKVTIETNELDMATPFEQPKAASRDELLKMFDENVSQARESLQGATDENLQSSWALKTGDQVHFELPKVACLRGFVMNHSIHHRAQLGVYLRLNDVALPPVYGPSADEPAF